METEAKDMMGSYVMSVLTGTLAGRLMSVDEIAAGIIRNGWAEFGNDIRPAVIAKLHELRDEGLVLDLGHDRYDLSASAIASLFGDDDDDEGDE